MNSQEKGKKYSYRGACSLTGAKLVKAGFFVDCATLPLTSSECAVATTPMNNVPLEYSSLEAFLNTSTSNLLICTATESCVFEMMP
jgi:hypothetical protein